MKWAIKPDNNKDGAIVREWFKKYYCYSPGDESAYYWHYPAYAPNDYCNSSRKKGYTEVSFEWFQQNILNHYEIY